MVPPAPKADLARAPAIKTGPTAKPIGKRASTPASLADLTLGTKPSEGLLSLVRGAFQVLNETNPNLTETCWICLASRPPYYEGIAMLGDFSNSTDPPEVCKHPTIHRLTLPWVGGQGLCIGSAPQSHHKLCNRTQVVYPGNYYLVPPNGMWWVCNTGLTPCVSAAVLDQTRDYCILTQVMPRIIYHTDETVLERFDPSPRSRREPVSAMTLGILLGIAGIGTGIGLGTTAYVQGQGIAQLQAAVTQDLQTLENSISLLEQSLTSLSEVVLQNRRGLDLLFLKDGGLCAALGEDCCFYSDHSGVIKDSMAKLRERLRNRQRNYEVQQGWFEGWFAKSPWLTTLISTLLGPIIIILLLLTFGPCIINRLV